MPVGWRSSSGGCSGGIRAVAAARGPNRTGVATESEGANRAAAFRIASCIAGRRAANLSPTGKRMPRTAQSTARARCWPRLGNSVFCPVSSCRMGPWASSRPSRLRATLCDARRQSTMRGEPAGGDGWPTPRCATGRGSSYFILHPSAPDPQSAPAPTITRHVITVEEGCWPSRTRIMVTCRRATTTPSCSPFSLFAGCHWFRRAGTRQCLLSSSSPHQYRTPLSLFDILGACHPQTPPAEIGKKSCQTSPIIRPGAIKNADPPAKTNPKRTQTNPTRREPPVHGGLSRHSALRVRSPVRNPQSPIAFILRSSPSCPANRARGWFCGRC